jgi:DNA-binding NtrC family response regulator
MRRGVFEQAEGGTLFLDEIGDMPASMQAKVLRAVQERQIVRLGGERPIPVRFWLICATNSELKHLVEQGRFREDLYYRINLIQVRIPPLRERREDILWLARAFTAEYGSATPGVAKRLGPAAESALIRYHWPGNVRELKHCVQRACILSGRPVIEPWDLFEESSPAWQVDVDESSESLAHYLRACERDFIVRALDVHRWQMSETASYLGISRKNLWEKMRKLEIRSPSNV